MTDKRRKSAGRGLAAALAAAAKGDTTDHAPASSAPNTVSLPIVDLGQLAAQVAAAAHQSSTVTGSGERGGATAPLPSRGREGKKLIGGHFAPEISTQLRILAAEENTTVQALLEEAISDLLVKKGGGRRR